MKKLLLVGLVLLLLSCNKQKESSVKTVSQPETEQKQITDFDWLLGKWKRLQEEEGKETFENWKKISESEYSGIGFTMQNGDTVKQERIRLKRNGDHWDLLVKTPDETEAIMFKGIRHSADAFTCENTTIEFPQEIKYWKDGEQLKASVSGGDMEILFVFEKLNKN